MNQQENFFFFLKNKHTGSGKHTNVGTEQVSIDGNHMRQRMNLKIGESNE